MDVVEGINKNWTLAETLKGSSYVGVIYLLVVFKILRNYMKHRKPFNLRTILIFYNIFQVIFSAYNVYLFAAYAFRYGLLPSKCWREMNSTMIKSLMEPITCFFIAKNLDLLETIFFVLRKKDNQVTFLHVYHHCVMITWGWLYYFYFPTDIYLFVAMINCFVHVVMYTYYALACLGPKYSKYTWWKKYLTTLQLTQFIMIICYLHYQNKTSPCPLSSLSHWYGVGSIAIFFLLFINFYIKSYTTKRMIKEN